MKTEEERMAKLRAITGEQFADYLILVRSGDGFRWSASNRSWAVGAAKRYGSMMDEEDRTLTRLRICNDI